MLATVGSAALVAALSLGSEPGGTASPAPYLLLAGSVVLIAGFVLRQHRTANPLLPGRVVADRTRAGAYLAGAFLAAGMFGMFLLLPYYLQDQLSFGPLATGLAIVPFSAALVATSLLVPRLLRRTSEKAVLVTGLTLATLAMAGLASAIGQPDALPGVLITTTVMGAGIGLVYPPLNTSVVSGVAVDDVGVASATFSVSQQLGGAVGVALLNGGYVIISGSAAGQAATGALWITFLFATALYLAATHVALTVLPGRRAGLGKLSNG